MIFRAFIALLLSAVALAAQDQEVVIRVDTAITAEQGAILRGLDRINGETVDFEVGPGQSFQYQRLNVELKECRYPEGQKNTEGFAYLTISDVFTEQLVFEGWMFASSPALSALDHPRYDVWVIRCKT